MQTLGRLQTIFSSSKKSKVTSILQYWNFKIKELRKEIGRYNQINCRCLQDLETNDDNENTHEKIEAILKKEKRLEYVFRCIL
uniref:Uncharacterized protein n=1 Tax=Vespula pensylvanica TaxID=30213 RepID=A0A834NRM1_VESPE|nr:hypothetical protein H0235_011154 [Vespula pensylvanica]